jgi:DnaD/phage-associated family protein
MIAGDIFIDDFIGSLSHFERLLWIGIITSVADDQGRMMDNPALIRSVVFLYDTIQDSEVEKAIQKIAATGKIVRYVAGNKHLIQIVNWWKYQTPSWASPSKYPAPDKWTDRVKCHTTGNKVSSSNWDKVGGYIADYIPPVGSAIEEGEGKRRGEEEKIPPLPQDSFVVYGQEIGDLTQSISQEISIAIMDYSEGWVIDAIKESSRSNVRNWKYALAILKRWKDEGRSNGKKPIQAQIYTDAQGNQVPL